MVGLVCPMRCTRLIACASLAALKTGSNRKTWFASTSVRPLAPDLRLRSMQRTPACSRKSRRAFPAVRSPLSRTKATAFSRSACSMMSSICWVEVVGGEVG